MLTNDTLRNFINNIDKTLDVQIGIAIDVEQGNNTELIEKTNRKVNILIAIQGLVEEYISLNK